MIEKKPDLWDYVDEELTNLKVGEDLMTGEEVMKRLRLDERGLMNARLGRTKKGIRLRVIRIANKTLRYRKRDVLAYEWACMEN